jgi:hypothetical protein
MAGHDLHVDKSLTEESKTETIAHKKNLKSDELSFLTFCILHQTNYTRQVIKSKQFLCQYKLQRKRNAK